VRELRETTACRDRAAFMPKHLEDKSVRCAIGARLRDARIGQGWSQERLAEALDLDAVTVSRIETGYRSLTAGCAVRAAEVLGVPVTALLGVVEQPVASEAEAMRLLRQMTEKRRDMAIRVLREIAGL
jgi:transcriptional regulator with XRE-family HTH domain